jgi:hypothetical protein
MQPRFEIGEAGGNELGLRVPDNSDVSSEVRSLVNGFIAPLAFELLLPFAVGGGGLFNPRCALLGRFPLASELLSLSALVLLAALFLLAARDLLAGALPLS